MEVKTKALLIVGFYNNVILPAAAVALKNSYGKRRRRRCARQILLQRPKCAEREQLCKELLSDTETFFNFTGMSVEQFNVLLGFVESSLAKYSIRKPISEKERLLVTLRFLVSGENYSSLGLSFRISKQSVHNIVKETTEVIWQQLHEKYILKLSMGQLREIADHFYDVTKMPNCIGAIDAKHWDIQAPPNHKNTLTVVLMAVCDSSCNFTYVNVDVFGTESESESEEILQRSIWGRQLLDNELNLPEDATLPNSDTLFPYYFVGNEGFPLKRHLLRPYGGRSLTHDQNVFNLCLARASRLIENSFGILASKFRIYHTVISAEPKLAKSIVNSTVVLHNFIRRTNSSSRNLQLSSALVGETDMGRWRSNPNSVLLRPTDEAQQVRDLLTDYLIAFE